MDRGSGQHGLVDTDPPHILVSKYCIHTNAWVLGWNALCSDWGALLKPPFQAHDCIIGLAPQNPHIRRVKGAIMWRREPLDTPTRLEAGASSLSFFFFFACLLLSSLESNKIFRLHPCKLKTLRMEFFWMHTLPFSVSLYLRHIRTHPCAHTPPSNAINIHCVLCVLQIIFMRQRPHWEYL